jgi:transposase
MTRSEFQQIYDAGADATFELFQLLVDSVSQQSARLTEVEVRLLQLSGQLSKDSHNSSKPPSSDGLRKKPAPKNLRSKSGKPSGGQAGHPGTTLFLADDPGQIAHTVSQYPLVCEQCHTGLEGVASEGFERRQVHDLPPLSLQITEHRAYKTVCPHCQSICRGAFPTEVSQPVQYGPRLKALCVYLQEYQLLPYARTQELLADLFGCSLCEGTLGTCLATCYERLAPVESAIKTAVQTAAVGHFDETGIRIESKLHWLHTASTATLTYFAAHAKRGKEATDAIGVLPAFSGTAVHDAFATYFGYDCSHALCNAHLLRELIFLSEQTRQQPRQAWIPKLIDLLLAIKQQVSQARSEGKSHLSTANLNTFERQYDALIAQGREANPPAPPSGKRGRTRQSTVYNLLERLRLHRNAVLAYLYHFAVPFDNNQAERDLRMTKVRQKISGCFRSQQGAKIFCRIRGYISTLRKQRIHVLTALQSVFSGNPFMPQLTPG